MNTSTIEAPLSRRWTELRISAPHAIDQRRRRYGTAHESQRFAAPGFRLRRNHGRSAHQADPVLREQEPGFLAPPARGLGRRDAAARDVVARQPAIADIPRPGPDCHDHRLLDLAGAGSDLPATDLTA